MRHYTHLALEQRYQIGALLKEEVSQTRIDERPRHALVAEPRVAREKPQAGIALQHSRKRTFQTRG
jgi:hypothetical protein